MCMFTSPVESVTETRIFARSLPEGRQVIVYRMNLNTKQDTAMVLPIPVKPGSGEKAVQFVDLSAYPRMMSDMEHLFPDRSIAPADPFATPDAPGGSETTLEVHPVGAFEASYVPTKDDFDRLDERFRMPSKVWDALPAYDRFGFVVFKFRKANALIHPMAFAFPRADASRLNFPTVHVHDGRVHDEEEFDHSLYSQKIPGDKFSVQQWRESAELPATIVDVVAARGIVDPRLHVYRKAMKGKLPNVDTVLA